MTRERSRRNLTEEARERAEKRYASLGPNGDEWRSAGFGAFTAREWIRAGFTPEDARCWTQAKIKPEQARVWRQFGIDDHQLAGSWAAKHFRAGAAQNWMRAEIPLQEASEWRRIGVKAAELAVKWRRLGFAPTQAAAWVRQDFDPETAGRARDAGSTPEAAARERGPTPREIAAAWQRTRIPFREITAWKTAGFTPEAAVRWRVGAPPSVAASYRSAGLGPDVLRLWHGIGTLGDLRRWMAEGSDLETAGAWQRAGIGATEAASWRGAGFGAERARSWKGVHFSAEEGAAWAEAGFSPQQAVRWRHACGTLQRAKAFLDKAFATKAVEVLCAGGLDADTADAWISGGLSPEEAAEYFAAGLTLDEALARQHELTAARERAEAADREALAIEWQRLEEQARIARVTAEREQEEKAQLEADRRRVLEEQRLAAQQERQERMQHLRSRLDGANNVPIATSSEPDRLFGSPRDMAGVDRWSRSLALPAPPVDVAARVEKGLDDAAAWSGKGPGRIGASEVRALRAILASTCGSESWASRVRQLLYTAATYLVSPPEIDLYLSGEPLAEELQADVRLPWPNIVVLFGTDFWVPESRLRLLPRSTQREMVELPYERYLAAGRAGGLALTGVVLTADTDDRPRDQVAWLVRVGESDGVARALVPASRSASPLGPLLGNIDAAVCWGGWDPTDDSPPAVRVRRRAKRRRSPGSKNTATRVVSRGARVRYVGPASANTTSPHQRRGHWRRQRIGPRDDWHYEIRWVRPSIVGGHVALDTPDRIYRIEF